MSTNILRCRPSKHLGAGLGFDRQIEVVNSNNEKVEAFELMCFAIYNDIQTAKGSGATALEEIRRIESGEIDLIEADGNAWVMHIARDKVWFEGLYSQGEGGEVSFAQYKLAVETYVRFLADPEGNPIEVPFPASPISGDRNRVAETTKPAPQVSFPQEAPKLHHRLVCHPRVGLGGLRGLSRRIDVVDCAGRAVDRYGLMCAAIDEDIQSSQGSGATALEEIRQIESGEIDLIEADGNAWVTHITRDRVWFEGLYGQGEGGDVSFAQYKLAVETFVRFLADPERKPTEVTFPPSPVTGAGADPESGHKAGDGKEYMSSLVHPEGHSRVAATTEPTPQISSPQEVPAMHHRLVCHPGVDLGGDRGLSRQIDVVDAGGAAVVRFDLMCSAIDGDIRTALGYETDFMDGIRRVASGEIDFIKANGNAWVTYISRKKVWFEGLNNEGEGGEVSFAQYKLAITTYVRFLADPERHPIEVPFPEQ